MPDFLCRPCRKFRISFPPERRFPQGVFHVKTLILTLAACLLLAGSVQARISQGKDVTSSPDKYFSTNEEGLDSLAVLPPPPAFDSLQFQHDRAMYEQGLTLRSGPRGDMARLDAESPKVAGSLSEAFGCPITAETTPVLFGLIGRLRGELGDMACRTAKKKYFRTRPYVLYNASTCYPPDEERLRGNGSYPSGHSARGWAVALLLSEINPGRKELILKRGYEMGQSRVICGYHWQSDVDAGRLAGAAAVAQLHANRTFCSLLQQAKDEFAVLAREGRVLTK